MATLTMSDSSVRDDVVEEIIWDPQISSTDINVSVTDGVVTLTGFVPSYMEKDAAETAAKRIQGVRAIANELEVRCDFRPTDTEIAANAAQELANDLSLPATNIRVTVRNGWVTLDGTVQWQYQRNSAEDDVTNLRGVVGITDNIVLKPSVSALDIKSKIRQALERNAQLDADNITVDADGSIITLSGTVESWAEKDEAETAAWSAPGVTEVKNQLNVIP